MQVRICWTLIHIMQIFRQQLRLVIITIFWLLTRMDISMNITKTANCSSSVSYTHLRALCIQILRQYTFLLFLFQILIAAWWENRLCSSQPKVYRFWADIRYVQSDIQRYRKMCIRDRRLDNLKTLNSPQQRNVVLHPEFVNGKYAFYTRPMDDFIDTGSGGGIGFGLCDDITQDVYKRQLPPSSSFISLFIRPHICL